MKKLDENSKLKDIYRNPIGRDILFKILLQLNRSEWIITNIAVRNMKLKWFKLLTKKIIKEDFYDTLLLLLNREEEPASYTNNPTEPKWWKEAVFYEIYPRSFKDTNGDGIGDLRGITSKLDYLKDLGINAIWLSPIFDSPNADNGYDIRDYYNIMAEFGTMQDFDVLLEELHARDMKLIMDIVVSHTSDEHDWFVKALSEDNSKYKEYYFFKENEDDFPPNNWTSFFGGTAWNYYEEQNAWALHLFSKKQMDLNWDTVDVRNEIYKTIKWWLEKGVDGFRLDVINYISKNSSIPNGNEQIGRMIGYYGSEHYFYGPNLHKYLKEFRENVFEPYAAFSIGETPGIGLEMVKLLSADYRKELDMVFTFDHLETPGHTRFDDYKYDLNYLKKFYSTWMDKNDNSCWMSIFYENHDNPRIISKINPDPRYREVLAKLLAIIMFTLKGTPFIYQGQEIGSVNEKFESVYQLRDIESINLFKELKESMNEKDAFKKILAGTRDHARTPMQWTDEENGGFTTGIPWIFSDEDYKKINVESQIKKENSILNFYKDMIKLRKENSALIYGDFNLINKNMKNMFTYYRNYNNDKFFIECNLGNKEIRRKTKTRKFKLLMSNYEFPSGRLRPYEANLYKVIE